ncbi:MAG: flagellar hook capping FlgD N-terminal domain-containing protein [Burkholderiaceae bacterium]|jgi:flagellar basal-body rod modification protein FlgD
MTTTTSAVGAAAITGTNSTSGTSSTSADNQLGSQSYFLQLLVAQMNNQDPLNPMDSAQVTSQMAEINTVSGIQTLNTQLTQLLASVSSSQSIQDTALVGQQVLVPGTSLTLASSGGTAQGAVSLTSPADTVTVSVKNSSGAVIDTISLGSQAAGTTNFTWNGQGSNGAAQAAGQYTYSVTATEGGQPVTATTYSQGLVTSVNPTSSGTNLNVAGLGTFAVSQVQQIQ